MDTYTRLNIYAHGRKTISAKQRRRLVKKAGRDPRALVMRGGGMGYSPGQQDIRELIRCEPTPEPHDVATCECDPCTEARDFDEL